MLASARLFLNTTKLLVIFSLPPLLCLLPDQHAAAQDVATLYSKEGSIQAKSSPSASWKEIEVGAALAADASVRAGKHARGGLLFTDGALVRIGNNTIIHLRNLRAAQDSEQPLKLQQGKAHFYSRTPRRYPKVETRTVSASVRGTEFTVEATADQTTITVLDGQVECSNEYGAVALRSGEQAVTQYGRPPTKGILLHPQDAVQWTLNYPSYFDTADFAALITTTTPEQQQGWSALLAKRYGEAAQAFSGNSWQDILGQALVHLDQGDTEAALNVIAAAGERSQPVLALLEVQLLLYSGAAGEADVVLTQLQNILNQPTHQPSQALVSMYHSQRSVIHLTQGRRQNALEQAMAAVTAAPQSPKAMLTLANVKQSLSELEEARSLLRRAKEIAPQDFRVLTRLAELDLSFGDLEAAEANIQQALAISPEASYSHTIMGFIELFKQRPSRAKPHFELAMLLDSNSSIARLGLGLTEVSHGNVEAGTVEFKKAAHLEPTTSLYRSYLGKAFFEQGREREASHEYELAAKLDPRDPTPHLYRTFNDLSQNRVVQALESIERSIELNDNRAIYRSSLLLDRDIGVRSASLARVFNDLGFSEAARIEAIKSINSDYTNYSAHRLLSESDRSIFSADASFSERSIADLLAPLSFNLFQGIGDQASFNDYNALFDKAEQRSAVQFIHDSRDDIYVGEVLQTGKTERFGYLLGAQSDFRGGTKQNNYLRDYRARLSTQYQATWRDRLLFSAEGQFRESEEHGGRSEYQFVQPFAFNMGYNRRVGPQTTLLAQASVERGLVNEKSLELRESEIHEQSPAIDDTFYTDLLLHEQLDHELTQTRTSGQLIYTGRNFSTVSGYQVYAADIERTEDSQIISDSYGYLNDINHQLYSRGHSTTASTDAYLYSTYHLADWIDLNAGLAHTWIQVEDRELPPYVDGTSDKSRFNPKAGVTVYATPALTFRAAYFETMRKASLEDQTSLEPTLVGGITQRFNDLTGTESRNIGAGADYKISASTYVGGEFIHRDLKEDLSTAGDRLDWNFNRMTGEHRAALLEQYSNYLDQDIVRGYIYQVLREDLVATADYQYALHERTDPADYSEMELHRIALALRYFHDSGMFAFTRGTWRQQDRKNGFFLDDGVSDFWIIDAGVGYRLPKRHGTIALEVLNLTDQNFAYDQTLGFEPFIKPELAARVVATVNF